MNNIKWLLFSYSIPSTKPKARVGIWRKVQGLGAVQLKTSLYVLPYREELAERLLWLSGEVENVGGDAAFFRCEVVENISDKDIEELFSLQSYKAYAKVLDAIRELSLSLDSEFSLKLEKKAKAELRRLHKRFETIRDMDYFPGKGAARVRAALDNVTERLRAFRKDEISIPQLDASDFLGRTWVTRARPYIDRLGSFWLIKRFIDPEAHFKFIEEGESANESGGEIGFDMSEARFTHQGEMITFEVLMRSFALTSMPFARIGELVRYIDVEDGTDLPDDAILLKAIVDGLVILKDNDSELCEGAMLVFDALHAAFADKEKQ